MTAPPHDDRPGARPPGPGPTERLDPGNGVASDDPFGAVPDTGRHLIMSLPPGRPESDEMVKWIASVENRLGGKGGGGGGGGGSNSDHPIPRYARKTQTVIDYIKWIGSTLLFLVGLGWLAHSYIGQFQTEEEAQAVQAEVDEDLGSIEQAVVENEQSIESLQLSGVQIMLEQGNTNDRLDQILELQQAGNTRREKQRAQDEVRAIQRRIDRRRRTQMDSAELHRIADQLRDDPLAGLE